MRKWVDFRDTILTPKREGLLRDCGLLGLRLCFGLGIALAHGLPKLQTFGEKAAGFPDPLGVGNELSMALAVGAEFLCGLLIAAGLATRFAALPLIFTMLMAFFVIHGADPFAKRELALVYLVPYITLFLSGPGRFSVDHLIRGKLDPQL